MIDSLKPYPQYRDSDLPWLEKFPAHWELIPNRALMFERRKVVGKNAADYTLLSLTLGGIIPRDMEKPKGKFPAQFNTYKVVKGDDLVFCLFDIDETPRGVGHSQLNGMITGAYDVFSPRPRVNPRYLFLYYLFIDEGKRLRPLYKGLRKTIQRGTFASLKTPCPPRDEQDAIVRFLDYATGRIERAIRAKKKLIALLNEQKRVIIHRAVSRGLSLDVPLKPSGIPWLGDIPQHWEVRRLKSVGKTNIGLTYSPSELIEAGGVLVLRACNIKNGEIVSSDDVFVKKAIPEALLTKREDILICARSGSRSLVGKSALIPPAFENVTFGAFMTIFRSSINDFVFWVLNSNLFNYVMAQFETSTINQLTQRDLNTISIPIPPRKEQREIVRYIEERIVQSNTAVARAEREIALLQEYRTRLTADIVTGKADVREVVRHLPAEYIEAADDAEIEETPEPELEPAEA